MDGMNVMRLIHDTVKPRVIALIPRFFTHLTALLPFYIFVIPFSKAISEIFVMGTGGESRCQNEGEKEQTVFHDSVF